MKVICTIGFVLAVSSNILRLCTAVSYCPDVDPIQYGDFKASRKPPYKAGTVITFTCDRGFKGNGKGSITCTEAGRWSDPVPYCTAFECHRDTERIEKGRHCRKTCETDAECKGTFKKCRCDDWCGKSCFNPAANCPALTPPVNGYIIGEEISYGYTISYGCNEGFILTGPSTRRCRSDRTWSGYEAKCVAFSTCGQPGDEEETLFKGKVVEGQNAREGAWPWQALLFHNVEHTVAQIYNREAGFAGGSIIDDKWILTAAHVFRVYPNIMKSKKPELSFLITVGLTTIPAPGQVIPDYVNIYEPGKIFMHKDYNDDTYDYDVALIRIGNRLKRQGTKFVVDTDAPSGVFEFSRFIRPVCLPCMKGEPLGAVDLWKNFDAEKCNPRGRSFLPALISAGNYVMVTGFGWKRNQGENHKFRPGKLQEGLLKIIDDLMCIAGIKSIQQEVSEARYTNRMLCAASINETIKTDACQGDSGGPLVKRFDVSEHTKYWVLVGIVSWGWGCGEGHPGYYTSVTSIMSWVWGVIDDTRIGTWYDWTPWSRCSKTCSDGKQYRTRTCIDKNCPGPSKEEKTCNTKSCPTGPECPTVFAPPYVSLKITPDPDHFYIGTKVVFVCDEGKFVKTGPSSITCQKDGTWSDSNKPVCEDEWGPWTTYGPCTATCNGASYKTRVCTRSSNIISKVLGCKGPTILYRKCNTDACPEEAKCGDGGKICLQGGINVDPENVLTHALNLFGTWFGGKRKK